MDSHKRNLLLVIIGAAILFLPFLGRVHLFDWDEINFAEISREMIATGEYSRVQVNYMPFWEKPPLYCWMQVACMKLLGVNEYAARLPDAICGIVTFLLIYLAGRRYFSGRLGLLWVLAFAGSFTPHLYFKSGIIDPVFNLFIVLGVFHLFRASLKAAGPHRSTHFRWSGFFIGLALLTKGPVALLVIGLCGFVYFALNRFRPYFNWKDIAWFLLVFGAMTSVWLGMEVYNNGIGNLSRFFVYQYELLTKGVASHGQPFYYHPLVLLLGCFPVSVIAIKGFRGLPGDRIDQKAFRMWSLVLFWVVLVLFSIVKTKIVHYSSLCYLPLTFLAAYLMDKAWSRRVKFNRSISILLLALGIPVAVALTLAGLFPLFKDALIPYVRDSFAVANMQAAVQWSGLEWIPGAFYLLMVIVSCSMLLLNKTREGLLTLLLSTAVCIQLFLYLTVPRIEEYAQGPAIRFYEGLRDKDCYVETIGFKSYAYLFYAAVPPCQRPESRDLEWLKHGPIDKPAYFVTGVQRAEETGKLPGFIKLGQEGGFVFFRRDIPSQP